MLVALTTLVLTRNIHIGDFKAIAEWLECYQYIIPANRQLLRPLRTYIVEKYSVAGSRTALIEAHLMCDAVMTVLTIPQQEQLIALLIDIESKKLPASTDEEDEIANGRMQMGSPQKLLTDSYVQQLRFAIINGASNDYIEDQLRRYAINIIQNRFTVKDFL